MSFKDKIDAARDFLTTRAQAYRFVFKGQHSDRVLRDLAKFCRATESCVVPGDDRATYILEGRREVWLRIQKHLNLTDDELFNMFYAGAVDKKNPG